MLLAGLVDTSFKVKFESIMFSCYWMTLGLISVLLIQCASGKSDQCESNTMKYWTLRLPKLSDSCIYLHERFYNIEYRINFTESEVETVCNSNACEANFRLIVFSCTFYVRKCISMTVNCCS